MVSAINIVQWRSICNWKKKKNAQLWNTFLECYLQVHMKYKCLYLPLRLCLSHPLHVWHIDAYFKRTASTDRHIPYCSLYCITYCLWSLVVVAPPSMHNNSQSSSELGRSQYNLVPKILVQTIIFSICKFYYRHFETIETMIQSNEKSSLYKVSSLLVFQIAQILCLVR